MGLISLRDGALPKPQFQALNRRALRVGRERFTQGHWTTFWHASNAAPTNAVELAIRALQPLIGVEVAGAEWWLGRMDTRAVPIDFHADRDNHLFDRTGRVIHPRVSSVLYLNRVRGGCLLVSEASGAREGDGGWDPEVRWEIARPAPNRFVWFRGDRVHGVLDALNRAPSGRLRMPAGRIRRAVIINWWARRPSDVPTWDSRIYAPLGLRGPPNFR